MEREGSILFFLVYVVFGLYFINYTFALIKIPEIISQFDKWIILVGGILLIFGAVNYYRASRRYGY